MNSHKVIWQEGMLLRPQHFQHNDRYYDHQMKTRTQLLGSYTWGFVFFALLSLVMLGVMRVMQIRWTRTWAEKGGRARTSSASPSALKYAAPRKTARQR